MNKKKTLRIFLSGVALAVIAITVTFICWGVRYNKIIRIMLDNPNFEAQHTYFKEQLYHFSDDDYSTLIYAPAFPDFHGNLSMSDSRYVEHVEETDEFRSIPQIDKTFTYEPEWYREEYFDIFIWDKSEGITDADKEKCYRFWIDKDLKLIESLGDADDYEIYKDLIREFYEEQVLKAFSEEVFKTMKDKTKRKRSSTL